MQTYQNLSGKSTIESYEFGKQRMVVQYKNGSAYLYDQAASGTMNLMIMKELAEIGKGLHTYISRFVDDKFHTQLSESVSNGSL